MWREAVPSLLGSRMVHFSHMNRAHLWRGALALVIWSLSLPALESQSSLIRPDAGARWEVSAGTGLGLFDGQVGWGVELAFARGGGIPTPFWMGLDIGIYQWDYSAGLDPLKPFPFTPTASSALLVQALPTFVWDFPVVGWSGIVPFLGLSVGPAAYLATAEAANTARVHETLFGLAAYLRPGVKATLAPSLNMVLEAKLGVFRNRGIFLPQFSLAWAP